MKFTTQYDRVLDRIDSIDPIQYSKTRNFKNGAVSKLSPYISRGIISTKQVMHRVIENGFSLNDSEKFIQELAWREYWQYVWSIEGEGINKDLKNHQPFVKNKKMSKAVFDGDTRIDAVDEAIGELYSSGYMHNHMRMYVASILCNSLGNHWLNPAKWLYFNLIDGDWASNALSWQWVAGSNSHRQYLVNQENINKYFQSKQRDTFLDTEYDNLKNMKIPARLEESFDLNLLSELPKSDQIKIDQNLKTLVYNYYNIDPLWHKGENFNRIFIFEPSIFKEYPISSKCIEFISGALKNIPQIQIYTGEISQLKSLVGDSELVFKEHPLNNHYNGIMEERDMIFNIDGDFKSFSAFWKVARKQLKNKF